MATKKSSAKKRAKPTTTSAKKRAKPARRERHPMPADVRQALRAHGLTPAYRARPPYQQNDYIGWITRAVRDSTRAQRIAQMLSELTAGGVYMKMKWAGEGAIKTRRAHSA